MTFALDNKADDIDTNEQKTQQPKKIKEITVNKYSQNRKGDFFEFFYNNIIDLA